MEKGGKGSEDGDEAHGIDAAAAVDGAIVWGTKLVRTVGVMVPALCRGWGACLMNAWMRGSWTNSTGSWKMMSVPVFRPFAWLHSSSTSPYALPPEADHIAVHARPRPDVRERIPHGRELGTLTGRALAGASLGKPGLGCDERRRHEAGGAGHGECQEEGCKEAHGAWRSGQESIEVKEMEITARGRQGGDPRHETGNRMHNRANLRWLWCVWWVVCWIVLPYRFLLCVDSLRKSCQTVTD